MAIDDARAELTRGLGLVRGFRWSDPRTWLAIGALVGVPILVWLLGEASSMAGPTQVFAGLSALLATVAGALRGATAQVRSRLDALDRAAAEVRAEVDARRQELAENVELARKNAAAAQAEVDALVGRERALTGEIEQLQDRVAGVTTGALLSEFLSERVGSVDYRTRLGTAALVQRDFRALSKLIEEQNEDCVANDTGGKEPAADVLNRIILYVDDLDRCEAEKVIDVLQAVHLLLAFPLFVVVVAVDSCWLSKSLADHYPAFAGTRGLDQATPSDYLEKIFQVAFWIDPLGTGARSSMVRGLLQGSLVGSSGGDDEHDLDLMEIDDDQRTVLDSMFTTRTAVRIQTAALSVTATELKFLDDLGPLLGTTPRSIKRFANVYQLLRALPPVPSSAGTPPYEELVAFLLALTDGLPCLMAAIRERIAEAEPGQTLTDAMILLRPRLAAAELARYDRWLGDRPGWDAFPLEQLEVPAERVRRFSFR